MKLHKAEAFLINQGLSNELRSTSSFIRSDIQCCVQKFLYKTLSRIR